MKRKPGRPPTPAVDRLVKVEARLHNATLAALDTMASAAGITRAEALRRAVDLWCAP